MPERLISTVVVDLQKLGQVDQNLINSKSSSNNLSVQLWLKSIHLCRRYHVGKAYFDSFHGLVTLKNKSRSPKSNQLFSPSQPCIYACLLKFHAMVQKISCRREATRTPTPTGSRQKSSVVGIDIISFHNKEK